MNAAKKDVAPDFDRLVLQTRAAHVYLDAIQNLGNAERRRRNRAQAEEVLGDLDRFLNAVDCGHDIRAQVEALRAGLKAHLDKVPAGQGAKPAQDPS